MNRNASYKRLRLRRRAERRRFYKYNRGGKRQ